MRAIRHRFCRISFDNLSNNGDKLPVDEGSLGRAVRQQDPTVGALAQKEKELQGESALRPESEASLS